MLRATFVLLCVIVVGGGCLSRSYPIAFDAFNKSEDTIVIEGWEGMRAFGPIGSLSPATEEYVYSGGTTHFNRSGDPPESVTVKWHVMQGADNEEVGTKREHTALSQAIDLRGAIRPGVDGVTLFTYGKGGRWSASFVPAPKAR